MSTAMMARPGADESSAYYHRYIARVPDESLAQQLIEQAREVERLFETVTDRDALARYAEGKWSVKEVLGHLCDTERIFSYRLLRIARGDTTPLPGYDENAYVPAGRFDDRPLPMLLGDFRAFHGEELAAASDEWQTPFGEEIESADGAGDGDVERFAEVGGTAGVFCAVGADGDVG